LAYTAHHQRRSFHTTGLKTLRKIHGRVEGEAIVAVIGIVQEAVEVKVFENISGLKSTEVKIESFI
jgi:hypothetical protein